MAIANSKRKKEKEGAVIVPGRSKQRGTGNQGRCRKREDLGGLKPKARNQERRIALAVNSALGQLSAREETRTVFLCPTSLASWRL